MCSLFTVRLLNSTYRVHYFSTKDSALAFLVFILWLAVCPSDPTKISCILSETSEYAHFETSFAGQVFIDIYPSLRSVLY